MNRFLPMGVALAIASTMPASTSHAIASTMPASTSHAGEVPLKAVVHVNSSESGTKGAGLRSVGNILKEKSDARIEVVSHAAGIGLVEKSRSEHAEAVESLIKKGVTFVACENTMRQKSIKKADLLPGVGTVPSGALEVVLE